MIVHVIDGTYDLFRHFYGHRRYNEGKDKPYQAVAGVLHSVLEMIETGATHVGVATDHIIESFRNDLYPYYKTSAGVPPELLSQFPILEESLEALGVIVWPMVEFEADDAMAAAAAKAALDKHVARVIICTPDKDLAQSVVADRIVQMDRRRNTVCDEAGVVAKFGVKPESIPDYLAVVGDSADGYPGLPGWGAKAAAAVLSKYPHFEDIPKDSAQWDPTIRGALKLASTLYERWEDALLFRTLATLRTDVPVFNSIEELRWNGTRPNFEDLYAGKQVST